MSKSSKENFFKTVYLSHKENKQSTPHENTNLLFEVFSTVELTERPQWPVASTSLLETGEKAQVVKHAEGESDWEKTFPTVCVLTVTCLTWKQCASLYNSQLIPIQSSDLQPVNFSEHKIMSAMSCFYLILVQIMDCYPQSLVPHFHESPITAQALFKTWEVTHTNVLRPVWPALLLWFGLPAHLQMMLASSFSEQQGQITAYFLYKIQLATWCHCNYNYCTLQPHFTISCLDFAWSPQKQQYSFLLRKQRLDMYKELKKPSDYLDHITLMSPCFISRRNKRPLPQKNATIHFLMFLKDSFDTCLSCKNPWV